MFVSCDSEIINAYLDCIKVEMDNYHLKRQEVENCVSTLCQTSWNGTASQYFEEKMKLYIQDLNNIYSCLQAYYVFIKNYVTGGQELEKEYDIDIEIK